MRLRPPRRAWYASLHTAVAAVILLSASACGAATSRLAPTRIPTATLGLPTAPPRLVLQGTTPVDLHGSPQGCVLGMVRPRPPDVPISSLRGYPGVQGEVALTFDDGPSPLYTRPILDELRAAGVHATFFVLGAHARRYPGLVRAEQAEGHAIGNHTYTHLFLPGASLTVVRDQLQRTTATIVSISGDLCLWLFRPPYGAIDVGDVAEAHREGLTTVLWDVQAWDWQRPGSAVIAQRIIAQLHSGAIILLHDAAPDNENPDRSQTANALPAILAALRAHGLRAVTLPQLLRDAGRTGPAQP